jgi:hypothetical protein
LRRFGGGDFHAIVLLMPIYLKINDPDVSAEVFDSEVLAINLRTGHYHSLRGSAVPLWSLLTSGVSVTDAARELAQFYQVDLFRLEKIRPDG